FDPEVRYDDIAGKFVLGVDQQNGSNKTSNYLFAVSNTSDPTAGFTRIQINMKEGNGPRVRWADFPHLGYNADAYTLTANMYTFNSGSFQNLQVVRIAKGTLSITRTDITYNN